MRTEIAENPRAGLGLVEAPGIRPVAGVTGEVAHAQVVGLTDVAVTDQLLDELVGRHEAIREGDHGDESRGAGSVGHLSCLGDVHAERLLAQHRQTTLECSHGDLVMRLVGRRNDHGIDLVAVEHGRPVAVVVRDAPGVGDTSCAVDVSAAHGGDAPDGMSGECGQVHRL